MIASAPFRRTVSDYLLVKAPFDRTVFRSYDGQLGSNAKSAASRMPKATRSDRTRLIARDGHSLHFGLNAPPTASQASVPGVAIETQLCSNDANIRGRTAAPTYST
jgi:hypothetical protein